LNSYVAGNRGEEIAGLLYERDIKNVLLHCEKHMDPFTITKELDIDQYSALICMGGDGSFNQMINGMLARSDKKRLPVGLIPAGLSNDFARSIGLSPESTDKAI